MASASTPSANEPAKDLILVHTVQLKPQISGRMVSRGISDVAFTSVHSEKTRLKKLMIMIIIITSETRGQSTGVVISITQYFTNVVCIS